VGDTVVVSQAMVVQPVDVHLPGVTLVVDVRPLGEAVVVGELLVGEAAVVLEVGLQDGAATVAAQLTVEEMDREPLTVVMGPELHMAEQRPMVALHPMVEAQHMAATTVIVPHMEVLVEVVVRLLGGAQATQHQSLAACLRLRLVHTTLLHLVLMLLLHPVAMAHIRRLRQVVRPWTLLRPVTTRLQLPEMVDTVSLRLRRVLGMSRHQHPVAIQDTIRLFEVYD
jgi:hypothetical protein